MGFTDLMKAENQKTVYNSLVAFQDKYDAYINASKEEQPKLMCKAPEFPLTRGRVLDFLMYLNCVTTVHGEHLSQDMSHHNEIISEKEIVKIHTAAAATLNLVDTTVGIVTSLTRCNLIWYSVNRLDGTIHYHIEHLPLVDIGVKSVDYQIDKLQKTVTTVTKCMYRYSKEVMSKYDKIMENAKYTPYLKLMLPKIKNPSAVTDSNTLISTDPTAVKLPELQNLHRELFFQVNPEFSKEFQAREKIHGASAAFKQTREIFCNCITLDLDTITIEHAPKKIKPGPSNN